MSNIFVGYKWCCSLVAWKNSNTSKMHLKYLVCSFNKGQWSYLANCGRQWRIAENSFRSIGWDERAEMRPHNVCVAECTSLRTANTALAYRQANTRQTGEHFVCTLSCTPCFIVSTGHFETPILLFASALIDLCVWLLGRNLENEKEAFETARLSSRKKSCPAAK